MQLIPTTFPQADFNQVEARLSAVKDLSTWIQIDLTDGILVKPASFSLELLNKTYLNLEANLFDIHLMVKEPLHWLQKCASVQASRVIGQVEMMRDREVFINSAKDLGFEAGLAFDAATPIDKNIPKDTDLILLMGRPMGPDPGPLSPQIYQKIKFIKNLGFKVAIDGGVDSYNFSRLTASGVDIIYSGSAFLNLYESFKKEN